MHFIRIFLAIRLYYVVLTLGVAMLNKGMGEMCPRMLFCELKKVLGGC